ncbi:MAG: helix-turn-helix domain-containing protein [Clostridia bacterium]|nr:helix-turn-helix domain-containing protein [Clostridia bacterium]
MSESALFSEYPDVITVDDLQNMLKIGRNSAYDILKTGMIKTIKIGKKYIIPKQSVINFLADIN